MDRNLAEHLPAGSGRQQQQVGSFAHNSSDAQHHFAADTLDAVLGASNSLLASYSNNSQQPFSFQSRAAQFCTRMNGVSAMGGGCNTASYNPPRLANPTATTNNTTRFSAGTTHPTSAAHSFLVKKATDYYNANSSYEPTYPSHLRQAPTAAVGQKVSNTSLSSASRDALVGNLVALITKPANNLNKSEPPSTHGDNSIINTLATSTVATATTNVNNMDLLAMVCNVASTSASGAGAFVPDPSHQSGNIPATTAFSTSRKSPNAVNMFPSQAAKATQLNNALGQQPRARLKDHPAEQQKNAPSTNADDYFYELISQCPSTAGPNEESAMNDRKKPSMKSAGSELATKCSTSHQAGQAAKGLKVGRIRRYSEERKGYGAWEDIHVPNSGTGGHSMRMDLKRGGRVGLYTDMLPKDKQTSLSTAMHNCKLYRQYTRSQVFHEPRFHVLLSSKSEHLSTGYMYHGIHMKAQPIDLVPEVASYAKELAKIYNLPNEQWDIGVDLIVYRDGDDSIGWHADDTQDESVVLCVVVDAPGEPRPVHIRPNKRAKQLSEGDEEIQLYIGEGMGYDMDGVMQHGYEHSLPKRRDNNSHRFVLIFRHGRTTPVYEDSGKAICKPGVDHESLVSLISQVRVKPPLVSFGHIEGVSEGMFYSRRCLYSNNAHRADQRGINGNLNIGADSIIVSRQCPKKREEDGLSWLRYTSSRSQGGGAMCVSRRKRLPVRVFRSSNLTTAYAPPELEGGRTSYRYDGLYMVTRIWDENGNSLDGDDVMIPSGGYQYTFNLFRIPHVGAMSVGPDSSALCNSVSIDQLWNKIQTSRGRHQPTPFLPVCPQSIDMLPKLANDVGASKKNTDVTESSAHQIKGSGKMPLPTEVAPLSHVPLTIQVAPPNGFASSAESETVIGSQRMGQNQGQLVTLPTSLINGLGVVTMMTQMSRMALPRPYHSQATLPSTAWQYPGVRQCHQLNSLSQSAEVPQNGLQTSSLQIEQERLISQIKGERLELECDFTSSKAIKDTFGYQRGMGKLVPLIREIAKLETIAKKAEYVRNWRRMTKEQQEQIKKEVNAPLLAQKEEEKRQKERRREEAQRKKAAMKVKLTRRGGRELKVFAYSTILTEDWRRTVIELSGGGMDELDQFMSNSITTNYTIAKEKATKSAAKIKSKEQVKSKKRNAPQAANKKQSTNLKRQRLPPSKRLEEKEPPRKITPRFVTINDNIQSIFPTLEAKCLVGRRKLKEVRVTVKWSQTQKNHKQCIADEENKGHEEVQVPTERVVQTPISDNQASDGRKIDMPEMEQGSAKSDRPRRTSQRLSNKVETYSINEKVFAWDKGHLYEATVLRRRDIADGVEYYMHFIGYKKSHERWLTSRDMIKNTPESRAFFEDYESRPTKGAATKKGCSRDTRFDETRNIDPTVGMRVGVRFTETDEYHGGYYYGKITEVSRALKRKQTKCTHRIKIMYDDGEEEGIFYPDAGITLEPIDDLLKGKDKKIPKASDIDASIKMKQSRNTQMKIKSIKKASKSPTRKSPRTLENPEDCNKATESQPQGNPTKKTPKTACSSGSSRLTGSRAKGPKVGMRVSVRFRETDEYFGGYYQGKITEVARAPKLKQKNFTHRIKIKYDDGDEEETDFPDPEITVGPIDHISSRDKKIFGASEKNCKQKADIDISACSSAKKRHSREIQIMPIKTASNSRTRKSPRLLLEKSKENSKATKHNQSGVEAKSSEAESLLQSQTSGRVPVAGTRVLPRRVVQKDNHQKQSLTGLSSPEPSPSGEPFPGRTHDVILSLKNVKYKQLMFAKFSQLGVRKAGKTERINEMKQEILSLLKLDMGQGGRFLKIDRKMKSSWEVDEKEAIKKIEMDLNRRNENKKHWLSDD